MCGERRAGRGQHADYSGTKPEGTRIIFLGEWMFVELMLPAHCRMTNITNNMELGCDFGFKNRRYRPRVEREAARTTSGVL